MAVFHRYNCFAEDLAKKVHNLFGTTDTLKIALSNTAPSVVGNTVLADAVEISPGNGYSAGGVDTQNNGTRTGAIVTVTMVDAVITASGGTIGPFRYLCCYNDSSASDSLIGYFDYGSSITLNAGETFTLDAGPSLLTIGG